ncbi:MAG: MjaI family restriction endonuclease [Candidatus Latescibacteria bacterium]|nr:MjaI family restriction endonuclease [Candidatus Latescibacterota bacterium]
MRLKLKNEEIQEYLDAPVSDFPKYSTQIINLANQNAQGTRPRVVGQMSDLIQEFPGKTYQEWVQWYLERYPDAIDVATDRITSMLENIQATFPAIGRELVKRWVEDLVLVKTFAGLRFQEAILKRLAELKGCDYRLAHPYEEAQGIDGFVGDQPFSIKPISFKSKPSLADSIQITIIYYDKKRDGITIEIPDEEPPMLF